MILLGMTIEDIPQNASFPICVTELGIIVFLQPTINVCDSLSIIALQLCLESYLGFSLSTIIEAML